MKPVRLLWLLPLLLIPLAFSLDLETFLSQKPLGCVFCDEQIVNKQLLYEEQDVLVVYPHKPVVFAHILILPRRHVERLEELTPEEFLAIAKAIQKVHAHVSEAFDEKDYLILQKNGKRAGQSVPHVHFHYLPRSNKMRNINFALRLFTIHYFKPLRETELAQRLEKLSIGFLPIKSSEFTLSPLK